MKSIGDPDYVYEPWTEERREKASAAAKARLRRPAKITAGEWQRMMTRLAALERRIEKLKRKQQ